MLQGLKQFRLLDWMLVVFFAAQVCQATFCVSRMHGDGTRSGLTPVAALLVLGVLPAACAGGALAYLGGWRGHVWRGALLGGIAAITAPWLSIISFYYR